MRRVISLLVATLTIGAVAFLVGRNLRSSEATRKPLFALIVEKAYPAGENVPAYTSIQLYGVRSDASEARLTPTVAPNGEWVPSREVVDLSAKTRRGVEPSTESVTTYPLSDKDVTRLQATPTACTEKPNAQRSRLLGYEVVRVQKEDRDVSGRVDRSDEWMVPALNCLVLRGTWTLLPAAELSPGPHNETEVTMLVEGEPPSWLFDIPANFTERSPSQVAAEYARRFPGHSFASEWSLKTADRAYQTHQRNR